MMDMIIKISEKDYNDILNGETKASSLNYTIFHAIRNGILLPKGHGRLIDADALDRKNVNCANVPMNFIDVAPTIIEADNKQ